MTSADVAWVALVWLVTLRALGVRWSAPVLRVLAFLAVFLLAPGCAHKPRPAPEPRAPLEITMPEPLILDAGPMSEPPKAAPL